MSQTNSVLDYNPRALDQAYYKEVQIPPLSNPVISLTGTVPGQFVINADMQYLLEGAHVDFDLAVAARANLKHNAHLGKHVTVSNLQIQVNGGPLILNLTQPIQMSQSVYLPNTTSDDFMTRNIHSQGLAANTGIMRGEVIHPTCKSANMITAAGGGQSAGVGDEYADSANPGGYALMPNAAGTTATPGLPTNMGNCPATAIGTVGANAVFCAKYRLNLSDYKHTLLSLRRDIYGSKALTLNFTFNAGAYFGYDIIGAATPSLAGSADLLDVPVMTNCYLYLPVQQNETLVNMSRVTVNQGEGIRMLVPETICGSTSQLGVGTNSITCQIPQNSGKRLLRCYVVPNNPNAGTVRYSNNNWFPVCADGATDSAVLYSSIQTFLNTVPLQNSPLNVNIGEDYKYLKDTLKGSAVTNQDIYRLFSFWVDNFTSSNRSVNWCEEDKDLGGISLNKQMNYQVNVANLVANTYYYVFYVVQKELVIDRNGMRLEW